MKVTIFNAMKSWNKYPQSPYGDDTFEFESKIARSLKEIFDELASNFTLNIPLNKNSIRTLRRKTHLTKYYEKMVDYIILDIDDIDTKSDRELTLKYFRDSDWKCILGESRTDYRIKGVLKCQDMTAKEAKQVLKEIDAKIPGKMDVNSVGAANYQAPILKNVVLYKGGTLEYPKPKVKIQVPVAVVVPNNIEQIAINEFNKIGFSFYQKTATGYRCKHPSEIKTPGGFSWSHDRPFLMTHWNRDRNVSIWDIMVKTEEYRTYQNIESKQEVKNIMPKKPGDFILSERYLDNSPMVVSDFLQNHQILKIQSPMGTAKSKIIEEVMHQARKENLRVIFLTNRISLADDICEKYDNLKHYLGTELEGLNYVPGDDLVVQIDSLFKFSTKYFDVCILDEAATTMLHLLTLEHHQKTITNKLFSLSKKKLVMADAFLFDEMIDCFRNPEETVIEIYNNYRDSLDLEFYSQKDKFIYDMIQEAKESPVTFSSGSIQILKVVKMLADENHLKSFTISAETPKEEKKLIYEKMKQNKTDYDILMYSPTLTVGVSNENFINTHYHLDTGMSMNVLSSVQMIKRTRQAKRIRFYLKERIRYNPTNLLKIQNDLTDFMAQDDDGDEIGISTSGVALSKIIKLRNVMENRHKVSFIELMKYQFLMSKEKTKSIKSKVKPFINRTVKLLKKKEKQHNLDLFEEYKKMSREAISDIEYKMYNVTKDEEMIKLFNIYKFDETLDLPDDDLNLLIREEINTPGIINCYKQNIKDDRYLKISSKNDYTLSEKECREPKTFGFFKKMNSYKLDTTLQKLLTNLK